MKSYFFIFLIGLSCFSLYACHKPSEENLGKGKKLRLRNLTGSAELAFEYLERYNENPVEFRRSQREKMNMIQIV